jgi:RHS repeat-associated protein
LTTTAPPAAGTEVRLRLEPEALVDLFLNTPASAFEHTFPWPAADQLLLDTTPPRLSRVLVRAQRLELELSEEPDLAAAAAAITVDGAPSTWTLAADGYTLVADSTLLSGPHTVAISTAALDLGGLGVAEAFEESFTLAPGVVDRLVHTAPDPRETSASAAGNPFGFHGLVKDGETGLLYVRNRYFDPELGRFVTLDPLGYADGPNAYQYALGNPVDFRDPLGLCNGTGCADLQDIWRSSKPPKEISSEEAQRNRALLAEAWRQFRKQNARLLATGAKTFVNGLGDSGMRLTGEDPAFHDPGGLVFAPRDEREAREMLLIGVGAALVGARTVGRGGVRFSGEAVETTAPKVNLLAPQPQAQVPPRYGLRVANSRARMPDTELVNFRGWQAELSLVTETDLLYRAHAPGRAASPWWTRNRPASLLTHRIESAVPPEWGPVSELSVLRVPRDHALWAWEGKTNYQGGVYVGDQNQLFIPNVPKEWITTEPFR